MISNFKLRKLLLVFALLMSVFGSNIATAATKYTSAEMYVDYIGTGVGDYRYRVTLIVYAACISSAPAPAFNSTEQICWASTCYATQTSKNLKLVGTDTLDNMYCSSATNSCNDASSTNLGFGMAVYSDTLTLANYPCEDWQFDWHGAPRDNSNNLLTTGSTSIDIRCQVYNKGSYYNTSTPRYLDKPKFILCQNSHNGVSLSPFDPNGDSLFTSIINPYNGTGCFAGHVKVSYATGYGTNYPIDATSTDYFVVNPYTGYSTVTPVTSGYKYNITYQTQKFDPFTGTMLGFCQRDMEYFVQPCAATPPYTDTFLANLGGGATYDSVNHVIQVCPNVNFSFDVNAYGGSGTSILSLVSDNLTTAPGSNFPAIYKDPPRTDTMIGNFSWKPTSKDIGLHIVTFHIKDSACSGDEKPTADFSVIISVGYSPDAGPDAAYCPGKSNSLPVQLNVTGFPPGSNFYWYNAATGIADSTISDSTAQSPLVTPAVTTDYVVYVTDASGNPLPCKATDTVRVKVFAPQIVSAGPDQTICLNQKVTLKPKIPTTGTSVYWYPDPTLSDDSITNPYAKPTVYGKSSYFAIFVDINKCRYFDSTHVITNGIAPKLITTIVPDTVCPGGTAQLYTTVQEQNCGAASVGSCKGTAADLAIDASKHPVCGTSGNYNFGDPTPYYYFYYSGGGRMQLIYTKAELEAAGLSAGYINNISFNVCTINVAAPNDSLDNFKISAACTTDDHFDYNSSTNYYSFKGYAFATLYNAKKIGVRKGVNTYQFSTPYYWDGSTNLAIQICYSALYQDSKLSSVASSPIGNMTTIVSTPGIQCVQAWDSYASSTGVHDGCVYAGPYYIQGASSRPATTFNVCQSTNAYTYTWTPGTYLNNTTIYNPVASNIRTNQKYVLQVHAAGDPSCTTTDSSIQVTVDTSTQISVVNKDLVYCRPQYSYDLDANGRGSKPISNLACGTANPQNCATPNVTKVLSGGEQSTSHSGPFYYYSNLTQWIVPRDMMLRSGMTSSTIKAIDLNIWGIYNYSTPVFKNVEVRIGCTPKSSYASNSDTISTRQMVLEYTSPALTLGIGTLHIPFTTPYSWDTTQNIVIQVCFGSSTSNYTYAYTTTTGTASNNTISYYGGQWDMCGSTSGSYSNYLYRSIPATTFYYCPAPDGYFGYTWAPGLFLSDSTIKNPVAYVANSVDYQVSTRGRNGCVVSDTVHIFIPKHNFTAYPKDTAVCSGQKVTFHAKGGYSYQWYQNGYKKATTLSCTTCANPISSALDTTTYQVVVTDSVACSDTLNVKIEIKPIPVVKIINNDTTIDYGSSVQLYAEGANVFTWSPTATLSNPNIVNPVASPTEPVTYTVTGIAADGCYSQDTVHVNINYRGKLFVPSAFTPNGDGKNDRFNVSNLTFEKILEFRVYNRWGQQVFEGNDNTGWDGKWKNVPQDLGAYEYLIRVGFPDGFVETFKGSVTLIR